MNSFINKLSYLIYHRPLHLLLVLNNMPFDDSTASYSESDFGVRIWFKTDDHLIQDLNELEQKFGNDERILWRSF